MDNYSLFQNINTSLEIMIPGSQSFENFNLLRGKRIKRTLNLIFIKKVKTWPGVVAHACNPSTEYKISLGYMAKTRLYKKYKNEPAVHNGRLRREDHLRSGVQAQPGQLSETPSLLKIQNLARRDGRHRKPSNPARWIKSSGQKRDPRWPISNSSGM
ncbi:hypothetical protein AAY473_037554 [Plecturocebus cupreus]